MSGLAGFRADLQAVLQAAGATVYSEYDPTPLHGRGQYITLGQGSILGTAPENTGEQCYPMKIALRLRVLDAPGTAPDTLMTTFEDKVLGPLLDGGYVPMQLVVRPAEYCRALNKMQLEAVITLRYSYVREEAAT